MPGTLKETGLLRPGIGRFEFRRLTALPTAEAGDKNPLPLPLPLRRVIQRDSAVFSSDAGDAQSNENTEKVREVRVVAPTGFEPVFQSRHVFALSFNCFDLATPRDMRRD